MVGDTLGCWMGRLEGDVYTPEVVHTNSETEPDSEKWIRPFGDITPDEMRDVRNAGRIVAPSRRPVRRDADVLRDGARESEEMNGA